jgi:hypothetical protein
VKYFSTFGFEHKYVLELALCNLWIMPLLLPFQWFIMIVLVLEYLFQVLLLLTNHLYWFWNFPYVSLFEFSYEISSHKCVKFIYHLWMLLCCEAICHYMWKCCANNHNASIRPHKMFKCFQWSHNKCCFANYFEFFIKFQITLCMVK